MNQPAANNRLQTSSLRSQSEAARWPDEKEVNMDYRTEQFMRRFRNAQSHLDTQTIQELISFKYREHCASNADYSHFVDAYLMAHPGVEVKTLGNDFGEQAWLVKDQERRRAILVQHETGLEILGAAGSIASLIGLIPLIAWGWTKIRQRFFHSRFDPTDNNGVEIRSFDKNNHLVEQQAPSVEVYVLNIILQDHALLKQKVDRLETQIAQMKEQGRTALEKKVANKPKPKKKRQK